MKKSIFLFFAAILCAMTANAYNQSAVDLYFDNSEAKWSSCYVYIGHSSWTSCYPLTRVSGTQYLWKIAKADFNGGGAWNSATGWVMCYEKWWDSKGESIDKYTWHGAKNVTKKRTSAWSASYIYKTNGTVSVTSDGNTINAYNTTTVSNKNYTVTINTVEGGTLTVKDYDNNAVTTGASKIYLTVLKFTAAPADGYVLDAVEINDGTNTTTIAAADLATTTHTLKSNVTINPVWRATTSTVTVTATATNGTVTGGGVVEEGTSVTLTATPDAGYKFVNWTVGGAEVSTANPYTFTADADVEVVANFEELPKATIYFVNNGGWSKIQAYAWEGTKGANPGWPGADITANKLGEQIGGFDVYSYTVEQGSYGKVIFNNGSAQTADYVWTDGNYYWHNEAANFAGGTKAQAEEKFSVPVEYDYVYFINTNSWAAVNIYTWTPEVATWPGEAMTKETEQIAGFDVYSYKVVKGTTFGGIKFSDNGGTQTGDLIWQAGKYYAPSKETWYADAAAAEAGLAPDPLATGVYLAGDMTNKDNWDVNKKEFKKETAEATTASVTVTLAAQTYKFKLVVGGAWKGNTGTMQRGGDAVHEGGWSFDKDGYDDNCQIVADIAGDYTFTWDLDTKKLTVTYPALPKHQVTATVNPAETGTVTGIGEYEQGSEATLVATPAAGYAFKNWTVGGTEKSTEARYTFTVNEPISLVANFIPEVTHEVTVSYLCNSNPIPGHDATTLAVGVTTPSTITAPAITNYKFDSWTLGTGVQSEDATTANPIKITTLASGEYTLAANYTKIELTYNVTVPAGTPACYIAGEMNSWTLTEMTKVDDTHYTITIDGATTEHKYKYSCGNSWDYVEKKDDGSDIGDRTWTANDVVAKWGAPAKCYLMGNGDWENGVEMEYESENGQYILLCHHIFAPFKFKLGDEWSDQVENNTENGVTWTDEDADGNFDINLPEGIYDFYFNKTTKKVRIVEAGYIRNVTNKYGTICLPYASASTTGATFYRVAGKETGKVYLESVDALVAGVPYIFEKTANQIKVVYTGEKTPTAASANGLVGTFVETTVPDGDYILYNNAFCTNESAGTLNKIKENRAYLDMDAVTGGKPNQMPGRRYIGMSVTGENEATGLDNIQLNANSQKLLINGQLIIIRDGEMYNAQGQLIK